jgi:SAM-dependent methyltransferase
MIFAWSVDVWLFLRRSSIPFAIADVRGLFWWHLKHRRPYQHLRMLEHALALNFIRSWRARNDENPVILDIGAEKSLFCSYLAHLGYRAIGLDLDREQMQWQLAHSHRGNLQLAGNLDFVVGSATELPFKDGALNATAISVIEHIEDDRRAFAEIGRVIGTKHHAVISFLYQDFPLATGQKEAAWKRAREHHPAYGAPRNPQDHILAPSRARISREILFWKKFNRRVKRLVRLTRLFEHSMLFDYFVYVRLARVEEAFHPGKQANVAAGRTHAFQWVFELRRS